jgi:hypothetical protein
MHDEVLTVGDMKVVVRFEVFTAVTMKNGVFWVVTPCGSCKKEPHGVTTQKTPFFMKVVVFQDVAQCSAYMNQSPYWFT